MKLLIAALLALPSVACADGLELLCRGTAVHTESTESFATVRADNGNSVDGDETNFSKSRAAQSIRIRIDASGAGKIKPPSELLPVLSRGHDGWWDLNGLSVTEDTIKGQFSLNVINRPSVVIDRHTGDIDVKGLGLKFSGTCERVADAPEVRKF